MTKKKFRGPKVKVKVKVNSLGRPLRFRYLLLQFLTDLDNSGGILFVMLSKAVPVHYPFLRWFSFCLHYSDLNSADKILRSWMFMSH